jgi:NAD-dependent dihydropyrimidine dehydrogenase PreA subunit
MQRNCYLDYITIIIENQLQGVIKMKRNIITIDETKCVGCGLCVNSCSQGALKIIDGKAKLVSETYCDGLGMCLPKCPTGALKIVEKDVEGFDNTRDKKENKETTACGCPSTQAKEIKRNRANESDNPVEVQSELMQWPCQIKLVPVTAPYYDGAKLLVAADCTAFANANIHSKFYEKQDYINRMS